MGFFSTPSRPPPRDDKSRLEVSLQKVKDIHPQALLVVVSVGSVIGTLGFGFTYKRYIRRIPNAQFVSANAIAKKRWIKGVVTSVGDADNFRLYHTPGLGWRWPLKFRSVPETVKELKDQTIHIRMAGIDAPEASHWGREAQEYSKDALQWLRDTVRGKQVWCQLLHRDQYSRIVALPMLPTRIPFRYRNLSIEMLKAGWATVYEQTNAEYGPLGKGFYMDVEKQAKAAKRGMWIKGELKETPAEYKRRHAAGGGTTAPAKGE